MFACCLPSKIIMCPSRVFSILLLFVLLSLSVFDFADAFPSNGNDQADEDWSKLTECSDFLAAVSRSSNCYRRCILDRIRDVNEDEIFSTLSSAVNACASIGPWRCLDIRRISGPMGHESPYKDFIPPSPSAGECVAVFVDEAAREPDWNASYELLKYAPKCRLHWVHPIVDRNFTTAIGQLHPVAITKSISPTNPKPSTCGVLIDGVMKDVKCVDFDDFLPSLDIGKPSFVDYLWIEKAWYVNDPYYVMAYEPSVCQISTHIARNEFRESTSRETNSNFKRVVAYIWEKSGFIPLRSELHSSANKTHFREFYFNIASPYCVAKYIDPQFGVKSCGKKTTIQKEKVIKGQFEVETELIRIE